MSASPTAAPYPPPPLHGWRVVVGTFVLSLATFMVVLDVSIANVAIPSISGNLGVSPNQGTWIITSFAVANGICLPLTGWLAQRFGPVRVFVTSIILFTVASWLCGFASNMPTLILFRILQGAVAGPMVPLSQALLLGSFTRENSGLALAMWSLTGFIGPTAGPVLGGWITDDFNWRWIFYINVPIGFMAAAGTWWLYRSREAPTVRRPIDTIGLLLLVIWVGCLQVMLDKGKELDWFESNTVITLGVIATIGFLAFLIWELTNEHPVVDLRLFSGRNFWAATLTVSVGYAAFMGNLVVLPLWLQQYMGYTPTMAGLALAPVGILALIITPWIGKNIARYDARYFASLGFLVWMVVFWMRSRLNTDADQMTIIYPTLLQGVAMSTFFVALFNLALQGIPADKISSASGLMNFSRYTSGAFGVSAGTTIWEHRAIAHHAYLMEHVAQTNPRAMEMLGATTDSGLGFLQISAQLNRMIDQQAYMLAANDIGLGSAMLFVLLSGFVWMIRRHRPTTTTAPSAPVIVAAD